MARYKLELVEDVLCGLGIAGGVSDAKWSTRVDALVYLASVGNDLNPTYQMLRPS